jgi:two-component system cell cycle response regulator DivK
MAPKRILVVEDEEDNLKLITDILEKLMGQVVLAAVDGHQAIQMAHEHKPDIILMDLSLPKLSGWEATRSLKSTEAFRHIPILALSAHAMVGDRERALAAGCDDYFPKPIDIDAFVEFMRPYLDKQ